MEENGAPVDVEGVKHEYEVQKARRVELYMEIMDAISPGYDINLGSSDDLSVALFGGIIYEKYKLPVGQYKSGAKIGETRYKWFVNEHKYEGCYTPVKGSEVAKVATAEDGTVLFKYYSTSEDNLRKIKCTKKRRETLDKIIEVGKIDKLIQSYLVKIPAMIEEYGWRNNFVHPNFNSTITITGRLSSDKPNWQNLHPTFQKYVTTRFV
jgi:DNA polymerase I-like protein with 3'-5' exonuclease and polymerase domains